MYENLVMLEGKVEVISVAEMNGIDLKSNGFTDVFGYVLLQ